jgi:hypothetical protein
MILTIKRIGGFAGVEETLSRLDTQSVTSDLAMKVAQLVEGARFFELKTDSSEDEIGADLYRYEITVENGNRVHSVALTMGEDKPVTPLRRLLASLLHLTDESPGHH